MVCYATKKQADEPIIKINERTECHAEIFQNSYKELNEARNKKTKENNNNAESKRNETNNIRTIKAEKE